MGTSRNTAQLVGKIERYAYAMGQANRAGTSAAALRYKEQALRNARKDTGGDLKLSNMAAGRFGLGKKAPKLGARYRLFGYVNAKAVVNPYPMGQWALIDAGSAPHRITPFRYKRKRGGGMRVAEKTALAKGGGGRKALTIPGAGRDGEGFAAYADHPGTTGKRTFRNVPMQAKQAAMRSFRRSHQEALLKAFK